ncbi:MAG: hypothetical protein GVY26_09305, partial [Bacteroidetes bacterium]|nr:hypothetical protein [Bacteroidota bacterium]
MRLTTLLLAGGLALLWSSCYKEGAEPQDRFRFQAPPTAVNDYLQLSIGNTWVYEVYQLNTQTGEITLYPKRDRQQVELDTMIKGRRYYALAGSRMGTEYQLLLRLSGPEAIDAYGRLYFATNLVGEPYSVSKNLLPEGASSSEAVVQEGPVVTVPHGTYATLVLKQELQLSPEFGGDGGDAVDRIDRAYYAEGVGLIKYTQYYP